MPRVTRPIVDRFMQKVSPCPMTGCWWWDGSHGSEGYGRISVGGRAGRPEVAHRVSWVLFRGAIPEGRYVLHRCDQRSCVNPAHLFLGSQQDNMDDMRAKGRAVHPPITGERNGYSRLTVKQAFEIRRRYVRGNPGGRGEQSGSTRALAREFGVSQSAIQAIVGGRNWRH